jgi:hypothetical protein
MALFQIEKLAGKLVFFVVYIAIALIGRRVEEVALLLCPAS